MLGPGLIEWYVTYIKSLHFEMLKNSYLIFLWQNKKNYAKFLFDFLSMDNTLKIICLKSKEKNDLK